LSSIQRLTLGPVSGGASSLFVAILLLAYGRIVRISARQSHMCHSFAIVWKPAAMPSHDRLIETTILLDLRRGKEEAITWVNGVALQDQWVSVITYLEWLAGCRNRREQRTVAREIHQYRRLHRTEDISRTALAWFERFHLSHGVGVLDSLIGATALTHHLMLATLNTKHFGSFPGLHIERPY
jgi:predicted nucleic acid-binding protein